MSKGVTLGGLKIKDLINEGRPLSLVLDSSIALVLVFRGRADAKCSTRYSIGLPNEGAVVPPLWQFEVANALQMAVRRKRVDAAFRDRALADLATMTIEVDADSDGHAWSASVRLSDRHGLTVYDAAYLELAQRRRLRLATLDQRSDQGCAR